jgi:hypothetical protein
MYVRPFELGWEKKRADFVVAYGFYAPVGKFNLGVTDNKGLGSWSPEPAAGATVYVDKKRSGMLRPLPSTTSNPESGVQIGGSEVSCCERRMPRSLNWQLETS